MRLQRGVTAGALCAWLSIGLLSGCVSAPKETVELTEIIDQQIVELQSSHERFVRLYYKMLRQRAETLLAERWTPIFLGKALEDADFKKEFERTLATARIDSDKIALTYSGGTLSPADQQALDGAVRDALATMRGELGEVMNAFADAARLEIQEKRRALLQPIDEQEALVLDALRASYADLQRGSAAIKGYLASVVNLTASRDAALAKVGLLDTQREIVDIAVDASDAAADLIAKGGALDDILQRFAQLNEEAKQKIDALD